MYFRYWLFPQIERCFINIPRCSCIVFSGAYFRSHMLWAMKSLKEKCKLFSSRGCFGCCNKPTLVTAVDEPSKGLRIQGRTVKKPSILEDFWSSSTCEMDNNVVQSRSLSSISISNQPFDPSCGTSSANNPQEFVNHGLLLWNQTRQQWLANKKPQNRPQVQEPSISWNASYESLLGTNKPFPQRVPLAEMVDFLVDVWEQEGLYD